MSYNLIVCWLIFFFFNDTATTEIYTLSLHDALPILMGVRNSEEVHDVARGGCRVGADRDRGGEGGARGSGHEAGRARSEEHTSELQSRQYLVCRLLLEKKKQNQTYNNLTLRSANEPD